MDQYTFDQSTTLGLALVAGRDYSQARHVPLEDAPTRQLAAPAPYLRQMHAVANSSPEGLVVRTRRAIRPADWLKLKKASA